MEIKKTFTLPHSWSELTWQQLQDCWQVKMRYGGNADVARVEALLRLCDLDVVVVPTSRYNETTGERQFLLQSKAKDIYVVTSRELSQMAQQSLVWFDYPYGDPGEKEVRDEKGKVVKEERPAKHGYVSLMHDAMILPQDAVVVSAHRLPSSLFPFASKHFALPQPACNNLTWQQYRSLQAIAPRLFQEGMDEDATLDLQAQFLAHCLTPRSFALLDSTGGTIKMRPHWVYQYDSERAEGLVNFWKKKLVAQKKLSTLNFQLSTLFHICFQCYQTAIAYYAAVYPLLFAGDGKSNQIQDALQGEVGTINAVMMKANYSNQQEVYDSNLPFILDILNTMAKEAKEIERMNAKIKKK